MRGREKKWEESFKRQAQGQAEEQGLERAEKVSKKLTKIPKKIKSVRIKKRTELLPLGVG